MAWARSCLLDRKFTSWHQNSLPRHYSVERLSGWLKNSWEPLDRIIMVDLAQDGRRQSQPLNRLTLILNHIVSSEVPPLISVRLFPEHLRSPSVARRIELMVVVGCIDKTILIP